MPTSETPADLAYPIYSVFNIQQVSGQTPKESRNHHPIIQTLHGTPS